MDDPVTMFDPIEGETRDPSNTLRFTWRVEPENDNRTHEPPHGPMLVRWRVWQVEAFEVPEGTPLYERDTEETAGWDLIADREQAEPMAEGHLRWDGCDNYQIGQDQVLLHSCSRDDMELLFRACVAAVRAADVMIGNN